MAEINDTLITGDVRILGNLYTRNNNFIEYGTCTTTAETAIKIVNINNLTWKLTTGSIIVIQSAYTNTATNPKLNINNTGAKSIWYNDAIITTSYLSMAGNQIRPSMYVYNGTNYVWIGWAADGKLQDTLATVATTGSHADLLNKPTGSLTLQGIKYELNSSTNKTANITVPVYTSDLTNTKYLETTDGIEVTITQASDSKGEVYNCYATKVGQLVFLRMSGTCLEEAYSSWDKIFHGTIENEYKPTQIAYAHDYHEMYGNYLYGVITSNGDISVYAPDGYMEWTGFDLQFIYFIN